MDTPKKKWRRVGDRVKWLREQRGWSVGQLSRRAGVSVSYLGQLEMGAIRSPGVERIRVLAEALEVPLEELSPWVQVEASDAPFALLPIWRHEARARLSDAAVYSCILASSSGGAAQRPTWLRISTAELCRRTGLSAASVTRVLERLEEYKLVRTRERAQVMVLWWWPGVGETPQLPEKAGD